MDQRQPRRAVMPGKTTIIAAVAIAAAALATPGSAQTPLKMTLFGQPSVNNDSIWLALERGLYKAEGLDVTYRLFPSGTTAFQSFQTGQGDIVMTGDLPSVQYFFRVKEITAPSRSSSGTQRATWLSHEKRSQSRKTCSEKQSRRGLAPRGHGSFPNI